jgi:membrane protein implicated in regulation of membrane protease activity
MTQAEKQSRTARVVGKYIFLSLPALGLVVLVVLLLEHWLDLPDWLVVAIIVGWVAKDIVLFPFVRHAFDDGSEGYSYSPVGERAVVHERLDPHGTVRVQGTLWKAELRGDGAPVEKEEVVRVVEIRGLVLTVEMAEEDALE